VLSCDVVEPFRCHWPWEGSNVDQSVAANVDDIGDRDGVAGSNDQPTSDDHA
jgi:hypothetical protein